MRPGQLVSIKIDSLPGKDFPGHVQSIQAGSGARFSLLPAENATGNYVKVVQRVPVKILFNKRPDTDLPIGPGESVNPAVKVQEFQYSAMEVTGIATGVILLLWLINWWGTRQSRLPESYDSAPDENKLNGTNRKPNGVKPGQANPTPYRSSKTEDGLVER